MSSQTVASVDVRPRYLRAPERASTAGPDAVELAAVTGLRLDPWQAMVLEHGMAEQADGHWSATEVGLIVARQNGKGDVLLARELAGLFLFGEKLILHSAHEFKTARDAFRRILERIRAAPELNRLVKQVRTSHGDEGIELHTGQRLRFVARSRGSGRGFTADTIILDEAYDFNRAAMSALMPTLSSVPNAQLWYASSAPLEGPESEVLRNLCKRGRLGKSPSLAYLEFCAAEDAALDDPVAWADANPSLGIVRDDGTVGVSEEAIRRELEAMDPVDFDRERLGRWVDPGAAVSAKVIPLASWDACEDAASLLATPPAFAFDVSPDRSSSAICAAGHRADGLPHVEVTGNEETMDHRPGTGWVVPRLVEIVAKQGGSIACDPTGPAGALLPDLRRALQQAGLSTTVTELTLAQHKQAVGNFYDATMDGVLRHLGQPMLRAALTGADKRPMGDAWLWSRQKSSVDITPLVAATVAMWAAANVVSAPSDYFTL